MFISLMSEDGLPQPIKLSVTSDAEAIIAHQTCSLSQRQWHCSHRRGQAAYSPCKALKHIFVDSSGKVELKDWVKLLKCMIFSFLRQWDVKQWLNVKLCSQISSIAIRLVRSLCKPPMRTSPTFLLDLWYNHTRVTRWHICNNLYSSLKEKTITMAIFTKV